MTYIIVGLGNPGSAYETTRHNTGRIILEHLKNTKGFLGWEKDKTKKTLISEDIEGKNKILYLMPELFMNKSGVVVSKFIKSTKQAERLIVIYDDLDLPMGSFKLSFNRGAGGHKGVESIINKLHTRAFLRIRVGISPSTPSGKLKKPKNAEAVLGFVMHKYSQTELKKLKTIALDIDKAITLFIKEGKEKAMNKYN